MTPVERIALMRAEEQTAQAIDEARALRLCDCGRPVRKGRARCRQCSADRQLAGRAKLEAPTRDAVLSVLARRHFGATVEDVCTEAELGLDAAHQALSRLVRDGLARRVDVGHYAIKRSP
jgi:hypothetical protein